jgi:alkanesulfonate monooxygenase
MERDASIEVFTTCPLSNDLASDQYLDRLIDVARWSDEAGCRGMLVFSDNARLDPWSLSHLIIQRTKTLCPLIAIQPIYMHPYWIAKQITTLAYLYGRRVYLNMVAGGFKNDLEALNDPTPHDKRYDRLTEYTTIIMQLLATASPVTYEGEFYSVKRLKLAPPLPDALLPDIFVSGSSDAGVASARALNATAIKYPKPSGEETAPGSDLNVGIRVGIIARQRESEAWEIAHACFPEDRKGQLTRKLAEKVSDSVWHKQLSTMSDEMTGDGSVYWLAPFQNYKAMCPYLVGSYDQVGEELARYFGAGYRTVILDTPRDAEELHHTFAAFEAATQQAV